MATKNRKETDFQRVENSLVLWLDDTIEETSNDFKNIQTQLQRVIHTISIFKTEEACIQFIEEQVKEKLNIIVSGSLGSTFVPRIHAMSQVNAIFIFDSHNSICEEGWMRVWAKIGGIFTSTVSLCQALRETKKACEQNCLPFSLMKTKDESTKTIDQLDPLFMYMQLIKENILSMNFQRKSFDQYLEHCRDVFKDNETELDNINDMAANYPSQKAIWWYTKESFLYPMLNRALRLIEIDIILKMAFFIKDLHQELEKLCQKEFPRTSTTKSFTVYRGQCLSEEDLGKIREAEGGLIAFNNFLSTSRAREVSVGFALNSLQKNPTMAGILYVMEINQLKATTAFASIESVSSMKEEDEVLFSMNSIFRIGEIIRTKEHERLFQVNLTLTNDDDKGLRELTNHIREKSYPIRDPWFRLGFLFKEMGHLDKAKEIFQTLLDQTDNALGKGNTYFELGIAYGLNGEPKEALAFYAQCLIILRKLFSSDNICLAPVYHNIGMVYYDLGDYSKALDYYKKALEIRKKNLPPNDEELSSSYNNIAGIYEKMGDQKAFLDYAKKALDIAKHSLPSIDPELAASYGNIGLHNYNTGNYSKALEYYQKALEIQKRALTPYHPKLAMCYNNIAGVYQAMGDYRSALEFMEKSHGIRQHSLKPNHPELIMSYNNMGYIHEKMSDYSTACSYYKIAVGLAEKSLPLHHPHRQMFMGNLTRVNNY